VTDALVAIRAEKAFAKLPPADRKRVLAALFGTRCHIEAERQSDRQSDRYIDRTLRLRHRNALKAHLSRTLKILDDDVGWFDATDWLTDQHHQGDMTAAMVELRTFHATAQALLKGAMAFKPDVGRQGRSELQLRADLTRRGFFELIEALESVGVRIGATGGKGGPGSRLLALLIAYAVEFEVGVETVKDLVQERRRLK
jgi:hypothetical protein